MKELEGDDPAGMVLFHWESRWILCSRDNGFQILSGEDYEEMKAQAREIYLVDLDLLEKVERDPFALSRPAGESVEGGAPVLSAAEKLAARLSAASEADPRTSQLGLLVAFPANPYHTYSTLFLWGRTASAAQALLYEAFPFTTVDAAFNISIAVDASSTQLSDRLRTIITRPGRIADAIDTLNEAADGWFTLLWAGTYDGLARGTGEPETEIRRRFRDDDDELPDAAITPDEEAQFIEYLRTYGA